MRRTGSSASSRCPTSRRTTTSPCEHPPTGFDSLRTIAVSRIYLDNFDHITAYWVGLGLKLAQVALSYGADDLHGTIIEEHIFHMAGAKSPQLQTEAEMVKAIREAGCTPCSATPSTSRSRCGTTPLRRRQPSPATRRSNTAGGQPGNGVRGNVAYG